MVSGFRVVDRITGVPLGGFAEYVAVQLSERSTHLLPEHISFEEGAILAPLATSLHDVALAKPAPGESHVILGAGIIGLDCLQSLRANVSCPIIGVDASAKRLAMAQQSLPGASRHSLVTHRQCLS